MANLRELRKHLASVEMTGQMAGAMKTASAVKFSRISAALESFSDYAAACADLRKRFGSALSAVHPVKDPAAPPCIVLLGANRGLCGGYNLDLYEFTDSLLDELNKYRLIAAGRHAVSHLRERGIEPDAEFTLPDTPVPSDAEPVLNTALSFYEKGEVSSVILVWQRFVNTLAQIPDRFVLLPADTASQEKTGGEKEGGIDPLFLPDRASVLRSAADACIRAEFFSRVLEAAAGHQAATLATMRAAYDNAEETAAALTADISHKRQSEVTSSVIETSGGNTRRE